MPITTERQEYSELVQRWAVVRDCVAGEDRVKSKSIEYLPPTPGMVVGGGDYNLDSKSGASSITGKSVYGIYLQHAEFPELLSSTHSGFCGIVNGKSPTITLPKKLEYLLSEATATGEGIESLWEMVISETIMTGRFYLLTDVRPVSDRIVFVPYVAESVINWEESAGSGSSGLLFAVCKESVRQYTGDDPFKPKTVEQYRELRLSKDGYSASLWTKDESKNDDLNGGYVSATASPVSFAGKRFSFIPLYPFSAKTTSMEYGPIPLSSLARISLGIYRLKAAYNRALSIKCDPQPWIAGAEADEVPDEIGGQSMWVFENPDAKVGYLDIDGQGIPHLRQAIQDYYDKYQDEGGKLLISDSHFAESGEAVRRRQQFQNVSLKSIAISAGKMFEMMLKDAAEIVGESRDSVRFEPDTDFAEPTMSADAFMTFVAAHNNGAPLSKESIHEMARRGGLTKKSFEDEVSEIEKDMERTLPFAGESGSGVGGSNSGGSVE